MNRLFTCLCLSLLFNLAQAQLPVPEYHKGNQHSHLSFHTSADDDRQSRKSFQMVGLPMYLLIDKQGNIVKRFTHITAKELRELLEQEINK